MENGQVNGTNGTNGTAVSPPAKYTHWQADEIAKVVALSNGEMVDVDAFMKEVETKIGPHRTISAVEYILRKQPAKAKVSKKLLSNLANRRRAQFAMNRKPKLVAKDDKRWARMGVASKLADRSDAWVRIQIKKKKVRRKFAADGGYVYSLDDIFKLVPQKKPEATTRSVAKKDAGHKEAPAKKHAALSWTALATRIRWILEGHYNVKEFDAKEALRRIAEVIR